MNGAMKAPARTKVLKSSKQLNLPSNNDDMDSNSSQILPNPKILVENTTDHQNQNSINSCSSYIKASLSMTSLPPNEQHQEGNEIIKEKLRMERPYNSLKKKRHDRDSWRNSWGSGHSHSSCSLHSNANSAVTCGGSSSTGKDDFWAALQTNYNYIMDTNLLDSCKEARCELEGAANIVTNISECCKAIRLPRNDGVCEEDPRELRKWLREMENRLATIPSLSEATQMSIEELQSRLAEHSVLYCEIVSHGRVVGACIKALERENSNEIAFNSLSSEEGLNKVESRSISPTSSKTTVENTSSNAVASQTTSPNNKKVECNLKGLERRYHLIYLKAIEVQCLFEGLLKKKTSSSILSQESSCNELLSESDDEPVSKSARYSDSEYNTHASIAILSSCIQTTTTTTTDDNKSEGNTFNDDYVDLHRLIKDQNNISQLRSEEIIILDQDEIDCSLTTITPGLCQQQQEILNNSNWGELSFNSCSGNLEFLYNNTEFDADSEGSDIDETIHIKIQQKLNKQRIKRSPSLSQSVITKVCLDNNALIINPIIEMDSTKIVVANTNIASALSEQNSLNPIEYNIKSSPDKKSQLNASNNLIHLSPKLVNGSQTLLADTINGNIAAITPILGIKKRQRKTDVSKFNRSNRKSKNCATFYFKHTDTDNEANLGTENQANEPFKSNGEQPTTEDDYDDDDDDDVDENDDDLLDDDEEDEGWLYNDVKNESQNRILNTTTADDSDKENKLQQSTIIDKNINFIEQSSINLYNLTNISSIESNGFVTDSNGNIQNTSIIENSINLIKNDPTQKFPTSSILNNNVRSKTITEIIKTKSAINCAEIIIREDDDDFDNHQIVNNIKELNLNENHKNIPIITTTEEDLIQDTVVTTAAVTAISTGGIPIDIDCSIALITEKMSQITNKEETYHHDSIKKLVLDAENLVRDENYLKTPIKHNLSKIKKHSPMKHTSTVKKREIIMAGINIQRVQEWLEHQPISPKKEISHLSLPTTDCEASAENTESSAPERDSSDSSEEFTDSVATYMQTGSTSHGTSTEIIGSGVICGSVEPIPIYIGSNPSINSTTKVIRRATNQQRRNSERPWSVSCLSQLTTSTNSNSPILKEHQVQNGLASHSISESAINILSSPCRSGNGTSKSNTPVKQYENRNSLKRRKTRRRKFNSTNGKRTDSGSEVSANYDKLAQSLLNPEKISTERLYVLQDLSAALSLISKKKISDQESEDDVQNLMKPNFKVGSLTSVHHDVKLGSLAALANYQINDDGAATPKPGRRECQTGTDEHNSSFSEQAWDDYQEKYNSENYSEGFDSDAARRLLEFGDDYRQFLDSQSDCCSSLSAANNIDSLSPPRMDSLKQSESKLTQETIASTVDHARRRRTLEIEYERRRRSLEMKRKAAQDNLQTQILNSPSTSPSTTTNNTLNQATPKNTEFLRSQSNRNIATDSTSRRLDFSPLANSVHQPSLKKSTSESDSSSRRAAASRRRQSRNLEKGLKAIPISSSSNDDSDEEKEMNNLLEQSRNRLEDTKSLKIRSHLLRPEDYSEIIATCRDNLRCLEHVLRGPPGTALSTSQSSDIKDLLSSWETLLQWSENNGAARKMQEEMNLLRNSLNRLGCKLTTSKFDSETSIQYAIDELMSEKSELQSYRTNMLRLNASVHSWLTRQEMKLHKELELIKFQQQQQSNNESNNNNSLNESDNKEKCLQINSVLYSESELHKHLKDEVSEMYKAWDEANLRITNQLELLNASLNAWKQLEYGLSEFHLVLGKDRGTLKGLEGALENGFDTTSTELARSVKLVAKLLSERVETVQPEISQDQQILEQHLDPQQIMYITRFTASNGSLSDSGISDGATSDGGLSERERRLGVLRRLAKQLENALAPGSDALKSIAARMEAAEAELKTLQNTCRDLIVRTAVTQRQRNSGALSGSGINKLEIASEKNGGLRIKNASPKRGKTRHNRIKPVLAENINVEKLHKNTYRSLANEKIKIKDDSGDPDEPNGGAIDLLDSGDEDDGKGKRRGWSWRVARIALPMQIALFAVFCAACLMQPHCCDSLNNFTMSFTPQLRYVRGPPPI